MSHPTISVVIPTCHRNDLLAKCLDCLAPGVQTLPADRYEVIVTDDGSQSTAEQMMAEKYLWAKWVAGPRRGPAANRNNGADCAGADFIAFTDDDCLPTADWLGAYAAAVRPDIHVYEGKTTCRAGIRSPLEEAPINLTGGCLWSCNFMVRRSAFAAVNGFDTTFIVPGGEDIDFRQRLEKSGYAFPFVENAVVDHPPRRSRWGRRSGALWESQVVLWNRAGQPRPLPSGLLLAVTKIRLKNLTRFRLQWHSFLALVSLCLELSYIAQKAASWQAKHSAEGSSY